MFQGQKVREVEFKIARLHEVEAQNAPCAENNHAM